LQLTLPCFNPTFTIEGTPVVLHPLEIGSSVSAGSRSDSLLDEGVQVCAYLLAGAEVTKPPGFDICNAEPSRFAQVLEARFVLQFTPFYQSKPLTQDFARVLITPRGDEPLDELFLMVSKDHIARWHSCSPGDLIDWHIMR
jgi:hypothetical protein